MGGIILVDPDKLSDTPKAFQDYVGKYFAKTKVLGREVLYASTKLGWKYDDEERLRWNPKNKGVAPGHSVEVDCFKDGLAKGERLSDWMRKAEKRGILTQLYGVDDFDHVGDGDD